jgi:hypothetical protein
MIELAMNTRSWLVRGAVFGVTWYAFLALLSVLGNAWRGDK